MSRIADIHGAMNTKLANTLTSYTRMPNPYEPAENPSLFMRLGYAVGFSSGTNTQRMVCDRISIGRSMTVVLINQVLSTEMNSSGRGGFETSLMNDQFTMIKAFENDSTLGGYTTTMRFESDSGIRYVETETEKFILIETNFALEYFESLT